MDFWQILIAAFSGGLIVKVADVAYLEIRRSIDGSDSVGRFVDEHLEPVLKSADEVVGKLYSLSTRDFTSMRNVEATDLVARDSDLFGLAYLICRFWVEVEVFKRQGIAIAYSRDSRGRRLKQFFSCLESRKIRLVDRTAQRAIGEYFTEFNQGRSGPKSYVEFVVLWETDAQCKRWLSPVLEELILVKHTTHRQRLLQFGSILHALIDDLDSNHFVTGSRPSFRAKLSEKSKKALHYRVFGVYLKFVIKTEKYTGIPGAVDSASWTG